MKTRAVLALSAILASGLAAGADAAVKKPKPKPVPPVCNLVTDAPGDANGATRQKDDTLDVVSADAASDLNSFTGVIRLTASPEGADNNAPLGRSYYLLWNAPGAANQLYLNALIPLSGAPTYTWGELVPGTGAGSYTKAGDATGFIAGKEIHITVPIKDLAAKMTNKAGTAITSLTVSTTYRIGAPVGPGVVSEADNATGKGYTLGAKSCVTPGK